MAGNGLANFREQFPQYSEIEDEELAGLIKDRYYPDMDPGEYRERMGLPAVQVDQPEPPTMWDRVSGMFRQEQDRPQNALKDDDLAADFALEEERQPKPDPTPAPRLFDQFFAGYDEYRANRATSDAFGAIEDMQQAEALARGERGATGFLGVSGEQITRQVRQARADGGDDEAARQITEEVAQRRQVAVDVLQQSIDRRGELMQRASQVPYSQAAQEMLEAGGIVEAVDELADDPIRIVAEVGLRSLPNMADALPLMVGGAIAGGPLGFVAGSGAGSASAEYRAAFADGLQREGVDLADADSMLAAAEDPRIMRRANEFAAKRSAIIGVAGGLSAAVGGRTLTPFVKQALARELSNVAAQTVVQSGIEAAGEAGAQLATEGTVRGGEVLAEAIGGAVTAPIEVGAAAVTGVRAELAKNEAARIESELDAMLGPVSRETPRETPDDGAPTAGEDAEPAPVSRPFDPRLQRAEYQGALKRLADDLTIGGDMATVVDDRGQVVNRTPSTNPKWFQDWAAASRVTVRQVKTAVDNVLAGREVGARDRAIVRELLDIAQDQREAQLPDARARREERRRRRAEGLPPPDDGLSTEPEPIPDGPAFSRQPPAPVGMAAPAETDVDLEAVLTGLQEREPDSWESTPGQLRRRRAFLDEVRPLFEDAAAGAVVRAAEQGEELTLEGVPPESIKTAGRLLAKQGTRDAFDRLAAAAPGVTLPAYTGGRGTIAEQLDDAGLPELPEQADQAMPEFGAAETRLDLLERLRSSGKPAAELVWYGNSFLQPGMFDEAAFVEEYRDATPATIRKALAIADELELPTSRRAITALMAAKGIEAPAPAPVGMAAPGARRGRSRVRGESADQYLDPRLESVETRRQLQDAVASLPRSKAGREEAMQAVNRAITRKRVSPIAARTVRNMLDALDPSQAPDALEMQDRRQGGERRETARGPDRRRADRRERVRAMSLDQLVDQIYTDPLTGIANRRAWEEDADGFEFVAEIDADSLKWINDNISESAGDAMLVAVAEAIDQAGADAYRIGGDEYVIGGQTREEVVAAAELAKSVLQNQNVDDARGRVRGLSITYGVGRTKDMASADLKQQKVRRESEGKRAPRGVAPPGAELTVKNLQPVNMGEGSNYVPVIGQTGRLPITANNNLVLGNGREVRIPKKPVRREHILALMQRAFGNRIYQGRVKGKLTLGFYRPGQGEIRIKKANDIEVAAHELAHWMDDRYPWMRRLYKRYANEVKSVSYDVTKDYEGFAEFFRLFMTQEYEVMQRTPSFYDAWQKELAKYPKLQAVVYDLQELMHAWTQQGARARLASKQGVVPPDFFERIRRGLRVPFLQSALDGLRQIRVAEMDVDGTDLAYRKLRLALGGASGVLEAAMYFGTPRFRDDGQGLEFSGDSLRAVFGNYWGDEDLASYMVARRARELMSQGRENLFRPDEIAAGLALATDENGFAEMFEEFQAWNDRMLDFYQQAGLIGQQTREAIQEMNQNYVPFHRVVESQVEGRGSAVRMSGNPFQRLKGGTHNVANVWDNILNNNGMLIRTALVNDGKRTLLKALSAMGSDPSKAGPLGQNDRNQAAGKYAAPIAPDTKPVTIDSQQVLRRTVEAMGLTWRRYLAAKEGMLSADPEQAAFEEMVVETVSRMEQGLEELVTFFKPGQDPSGSVDFYMEDGKKVWFEIGDDALWNSLQFLGPKGSNFALNILGGFSGALRRGVVSLPVFQIKNFLRDTLNAWLLSDNVKAPAARAMRVVMSKMEADPSYQEMLLNGGGFANRAQGLEAQRKIIVDPTRLAAVYDRFLGRFENSNRLAEYKAAREAGESPRNAALLSREISTDFAMRGSHEVARFLSIAVPFLNARLQGNYRLARQFTRREAAISLGLRGTALMSATIALYMLNKDDERYEELPEDVKDLNWVFFTGNGEDDYFLIPKPFETGMLFATIPERMFELVEERDGKEFVDAMGWMFLQTFAMDLTPQVFTPEQEIARNKAWTGAPIVPFYLENVEPSQQYTYYTSETARALGEKLGLSPIKTEYRLRGYLGTLGTYALGASDALITAMSDPDDLAFGEDPTRGETWRENILVRGLIDPLVSEGPPRRTKYVTDLYDMIREAQLVANTSDLMLRRQNAEVEQYMQDPQNRPLIAVNQALQDAREALNENRKSADAVRMDREMDGDEKRVELWKLTRQRNAIARQAVLEIQRAKDQEAERARAATP